MAWLLTTSGAIIQFWIILIKNPFALVSPALDTLSVKWRLCCPWDWPEMCFHMESARGVLCNQVWHLSVLEKCLNSLLSKKWWTKEWRDMGCNHHHHPNLNRKEILQSFWCSLRPHSCTQKLFSCDHTNSLVGYILIVQAIPRSEVRSS